MYMFALHTLWFGLNIVYFHMCSEQRNTEVYPD